LTVKFAQPAAALDGIKLHTQNTAGHAEGQEVDDADRERRSPALR